MGLSISSAVMGNAWESLVPRSARIRVHRFPFSAETAGITGEPADDDVQVWLPPVRREAWQVRHRPLAATRRRGHRSA